MRSMVRLLMLLLTIIGLIAFLPACGGGSSSAPPADDGSGGGDDGGGDGSGDGDTQIQTLEVDPQAAANVSVDASIQVAAKVLGLNVGLQGMSVASVSSAKALTITNIINTIDCESGDISITGEERSRAGDHCTSIIDVSAQFNDCALTVNRSGVDYTATLRGSQQMAIVKGQYQCAAPVYQLEVITNGAMEVVGDTTISVTAMHYKTDLDSTTGETSRFGFISAATEQDGAEVLCEVNPAGSITCDESYESSILCSDDSASCEVGEAGDAYCRDVWLPITNVIAYGAACDRGCCRFLNSPDRRDCWSCTGKWECPESGADVPYKLTYLEDGLPREYEIPIHCALFGIWQFRECVVDEDCRNGALCDQDFVGGFCACDIGDVCHDAPNQEILCGKGQNMCCSDGLDNDFDSLIDCNDNWGECSFSYHCSTTEAETVDGCTNGITDDEDAYKDCADPDCCSDDACSLASSVCVCTGNGYEYHGCDPLSGMIYDPSDPTNATYMGYDPRTGEEQTCTHFYGGGWICVSVTPEMGCCAPPQ